MTENILLKWKYFVISDKMCGSLTRTLTMLTRIMMMAVVMLVRDVKCSMNGNNENYFHNSYQVKL